MDRPMLPGLKLTINQGLADFDEILPVYEEEELLKLQVGKRDPLTRCSIQYGVGN